MKKILILFTFYILLFTNIVFASFDVSLSIDKNNLDINDVLNFSIELSSTDAVDYNIEEIKGLENFDIVGQSKSTQFRSINGNTSIITSINLSLKAKEVGNYTLGPVMLSEDGSIKEYSETIGVEVTGAKIFVGNSEDIKLQDEEEETQTSPQPSPLEEREQEQLSSAMNNTSINGDETKEEVKEVLDLEGNPMSDVYDIKRNLFGFPINLVLSFFYLIFFVVVYVLYNFYIKQRETKSTKQAKEIIEKKEIDFIALLNKLEKNHIDIEKEVFYRKLGDIIRLYLDNKIVEGLSTKTLRELKDSIDSQLYALIEKVYFLEYDGKQDSIENRKEVLKEFKRIV
ncbi:MAG: BatD family protein [Candidatus Gracilibacteria bacterium]|nr:BatD family protein [Candidatus Gracilibacteria bacterium]